MRVGLLSDIHGNEYALRSVLRTLRGVGVDQFVCAGDLVGYGPQPNECVEIMAALQIPCVAGNHDLMATGRLSGEPTDPLARLSHHWTQDVLRDDARRYLADLPLVVNLGDVVLAHGSLVDPQARVGSAAEARTQLELLRTRYPRADFLVLGHVHVTWAFQEPATALQLEAGRPARLRSDSPALMSPGSVGQSRSRERVPRARCLVLDLERRSVEAFLVEYDVASCLSILDQCRLPYESIHRPPRRFGKAVRRIGRNGFRFDPREVERG